MGEYSDDDEWAHCESYPRCDHEHTTGCDGRVRLLRQVVEAATRWSATHTNITHSPVDEALREAVRALREAEDGEG
jgi:hypothetical protein